MLKTEYQTNSSTPLLSIITVVLNARESLGKTISSVVDQEFNDYEYYVIDGGSTDGTIEVIKSFDSVIDFWMSEPDSGISEAFNKGISMSRGKYILLLNADDWLEPEALNKISESLHSDADIIYGKMNYWKDNKLVRTKAGSHKTLCNGLRGMTIPHPACVVSRQLYDRIGLYDPEYKNAMDYHFVLRAAKSDVKFQSVEYVITNFSSGGMTSKHQLRSLLEERKAKLEILGLNLITVNLQFLLKFILIYILGSVLHKIPLDQFK